MIKVESYLKKKPSASNTAGGGYAVGNNVTVNQTVNLETHQFWGNNFNGTQDVTGTIIADNGIEASDIKSNTVSATKYSGDTIIVSSASTTNITNSNHIKTKTLEVTESASTPTLSATTINVTNLNSTDIHNTNQITTKDLVVNGNAHFFNLVIDEVKAAGGTIILSAADAKVELVDNYSVDNDNPDILEDLHYECGIDVNPSDEVDNPTGMTEWLFTRLRWKATDDSGNETVNKWQKFDQCLCWRCGLKAQTGGSGTTKHYWGIVWNVGTVTSNGQKWHYIDILKGYRYYVIDGEGLGQNVLSLMDSDVEPAVGDELVLAGHRAPEGDKNRKACTILSAYKSPDVENGFESPSIVQYENIDRYTFKDKYVTVLSPTFNYFDGNFSVKATNNITLNVLNDVADDLAKTGIDIKNHKIELTTNQFFITNEEGDTNVFVDVNGNLITRGVQQQLIEHIRTQQQFDNRFPSATTIPVSSNYYEAFPVSKQDYFDLYTNWGQYAFFNGRCCDVMSIPDVVYLEAVNLGNGNEQEDIWLPHINCVGSKDNNLNNGLNYPQCYFSRTYTRQGEQSKSNKHLIGWEELHQIIGRRITIFNFTSKQFNLIGGYQPINGVNERVSVTDNGTSQFVDINTVVDDTIDGNCYRNSGNNVADGIPLRSGEFVTIECYSYRSVVGFTSATNYQYSNNIGWRVIARSMTGGAGYGVAQSSEPFIDKSEWDEINDILPE